jgi:hypothetical protein
MNFVTNRPKLLWLIMLVVIASVLFGAATVLLVNLTHSETIHRFAFWILVFLWSACAALVLVYWARQLSGKYVGMEPRPLKHQIW